MRQGQIFEPEIVDAAARFIRRDSVLLDVGASYGQRTVEFPRRVGEGGAVYSFETQKYVFEILKKNLAANNCRNAIAVYGAVYDTDGVDIVFPEPYFIRFSSYGSYGLAPGATKGPKVQSVTDDSLAIDRKISFMKVDAQGSDLFAMRGARETIRRHRMPILFEYEEQFQNEFETCFQDYVEFVAAIGYKFLETINKINYLIVPR